MMPPRSWLGQLDGDGNITSWACVGVGGTDLWKGVEIIEFAELRCWRTPRWRCMKVGWVHFLSLKGCRLRCDSCNLGEKDVLQEDKVKERN